MNSKAKSKLIGHIVNIYRYPVKSMAPEILKVTDVSWFGVAGDRRWAFVRDKTIKSSFPWLTIRNKNDMGHYKPHFIDKAKPDKSNIIIEAPSGKLFDISDTELSKELYSKGAKVMKYSRGIFDTFPLSLITTQTINSLSESIDLNLTPERFRPNFVIKTIENESFPEDKWVGHNIRIGKMCMRIDERDKRCNVINVDPLTSQISTNALNYVKKNREGCLGVYGSTVTPGVVSIKDEVYLEY